MRAARVAPRAGNFFVDLIGSGVAGAAVGAVVLATSPAGLDKELARAQTAAGAIPLGAALGADVVAHAIPGLSALLTLVAEPAGAAAGVAYVMVSSAAFLVGQSKQKTSRKPTSH